MPLISRTLTTALAALLIAAPAATAVSVDSSAQLRGAANTQDLRSPDARDAATTQASNVFTGGVRAPDLLAPIGHQATTAVAPTARTPDTPTVVEVRPARGFDWTSAGIGAGGAIALLVIALAGAATVAGRSRQAAH